MSLPGTTLEEEFRRRNAAINAVADYCKFEEGGAPARRGGRQATKPPVQKPNPQLMAARAEEQALSAAMLSVFTEKRPTVCFICVARKNLPFNKRTYAFASPGDLTKHFKRKHLSNSSKGERYECNVCLMPLKDKMHLQNHAHTVHGTVS